MGASEGGGAENRSRMGGGRPDRFDRRAIARGLLVSVLVHAAVFAAVRAGPRFSPPTDGSSTSARRPAVRPAPDALEAVLLAVAPAEARLPPRPSPVVVEPRVTVVVPRPGSAVLDPVLERPLSGPGPGGAERGNRSSGTVGSAGHVPAVPRSVFPEWDPPDSVKGTEVTLRVRVDADGHPTGEVELVPPTPDRTFNRELVDKALRMEYRPALEGGVPVAGWAEITFVF